MEQIHAGGGGAANLAPGQRTAPGVNFAHFHPALGAELLKRGKAAEIWDIIFFFFFPLGVINMQIYGCSSKASS